MAISFTCNAGLITPGVTLTGSGTSYTINAVTALIDVTVDPGTFIMETGGISIGTSHRWFLVSDGTIIDSTIASRATEITGSGSQFLMDPQPFMLGFWLYPLEAPMEPLLEYNFGWAEFTYDGNSLSLVDSAKENDGLGIIAGQYAQVPEPSSIFLLGIGGVGAWLLRKNTKHSLKT